MSGTCAFEGSGLLRLCLKTAYGIHGTATVTVGRIAVNQQRNVQKSKPLHPQSLKDLFREEAMSQVPVKWVYENDIRDSRDELRDYEGAGDPIPVVPLSALDEEEFEIYPHKGPCHPDAGCDNTCAVNYGIAERNIARRTIKRLLASLGEGK